MKRWVVLVALLVGFGLVALFVSVTAYVGNRNTEDRFVELVNKRRRALHLGQLQIGSFLRDYAQGRANDMARRGSLGSHDNCYLCGEVLGVTSGGPERMFVLFMRSPVHRHILLQDEAKLIGCGVAQGNGWGWWACETRL